MKDRIHAHLVGLMLAACVRGAWAETTVAPAHAYAYAANAGWVNAAGDVSHGVQIGTSYCAGFLWSPALGWIGWGSAPTNGWLYTNLSADDWGVNHDGLGRLTGYAYGANIGWVNFEQTYGKPRVDLRTGVMSGAAWSPNVGWITFSNAVAHVRMARLETGPDSDGDGIGDPWEYQMAGGLTRLQAGGSDWDEDGMPDLAEFWAGTDPLDALSGLRISKFARSGGMDQVTWPGLPTRLYRLEWRASLAAGDVWSDSGAGVISGNKKGNLIRTVAAPEAARRFYRVRALMPFSE